VTGRGSAARGYCLFDARIGVVRSRGGGARRNGCRSCGVVGSRIRTVRLRSERRSLRGLVCVGINGPISFNPLKVSGLIRV
jgi:hypothetical protein